jgi:putative flippase GtrA
MMLRWLRQSSLLRFLVVGGGMAVVYSVTAALATTYLPLPKSLSSALVWILCIPLGFWCHRRFTFAGSTPHRHALWLYAGVQAAGIGIAATNSHFLARGAFWPDLAVHFFSALLAAIVSYVVNRLVVFPRSRSD